MSPDARGSSCHQTGMCSCGRGCFLSPVGTYLNGCQFAFLPSPLSKHWISSSGKSAPDHRPIRFYCQELIYLPGETRGWTPWDERGRQTTSAQHSPWCCHLTHLIFVKMFKSGNVLFLVLPDSSFICYVYYLGYTTWYHKKKYSRCMKTIIINLSNQSGPW